MKIWHEYGVVRTECSGAHLADGGITPGFGPQVGDTLMTGSSMLACVDRSGRPAGMPEWLVPRN